MVVKASQPLYMDMAEHITMNIISSIICSTMSLSTHTTSLPISSPCWSGNCWNGWCYRKCNWSEQSTCDQRSNIGMPLFFQRPRVYTGRWQDVTNVQCGSVGGPLKFRAVIGQGRSSSVIGWDWQQGFGECPNNWGVGGKCYLQYKSSQTGFVR